MASLARLPVALSPRRVIAFVWFLAGIAAAAAIAAIRRVHAARRAPAHPAAARGSATAAVTALADGAEPSVPPAMPLAVPLAVPPAVPPAVPLAAPIVAPDSRRLACSLADELADLASGVEGRAHHLIEAVGDRKGVPHAAEALMNAVQRLRRLHNKLAAFGHVERSRSNGPTAVSPLIATLRGELQAMQFGLELRWEPPEHLPDIAIPADVANDALLFLGGSMLRAERGATHFAIAAETCFAAPEPRLQIELVLEWSSDGHTPTTAHLSDPTFTLDLEASRQLIVEHGGELAIHHLPGRTVRAVVHWPLAKPVLLEAPETAPPVLPPPPAARPVEHRYGGALVLEADPSVRAMVARELKATGRAVFACADASSARTFLEATPDRFELLIIDHPQRLDSAEALAATIRTLAPTLKIFVMASAPQATNAAWPHLHHLQKPFGVHELRTALASVLAAG